MLVCWLGRLKLYLFEAPVCQGPQVCQHCRVSETDVVKLSFTHLCHQSAQGQQLIGPQLPHWAEGLFLHQTMKMPERNTDVFRQRLNAVRLIVGSPSLTCLSFTHNARRCSALIEVS